MSWGSQWPSTPRDSRSAQTQRGTRPQQRSCRHMIGLTTDDITADGKRFKDAGVEFIEDPTDYDTVRAATFNDPEGNLLRRLYLCLGHAVELEELEKVAFRIVEGRSPDGVIVRRILDELDSSVLKTLPVRRDR